MPSSSSSSKSSPSSSDEEVQPVEENTKKTSDITPENAKDVNKEDSSESDEETHEKGSNVGSSTVMNEEKPSKETLSEKQNPNDDKNDKTNASSDEGPEKETNQEEKEKEKKKKGKPKRSKKSEVVKATKEDQKVPNDDHVKDTLDTPEAEKKSSPITSGWLEKKGIVRRRWKKLWFVLQDCKLSYYASNKENEKERGSETIRSAKVFARVEKRGKELPTYFDVRLQNRDLLLRASSIEEKDMWIKAIREASQSNSEQQETTNKALHLLRKISGRDGFQGRVSAKKDEKVDSK